MGKDKGLLKTQNTPWAKVIANIFVDLDIEYVLSINASQKEPYTQVFDEKILITDNDLSVRGPLKGLLTVHERYPDFDLLLIACDLQDLDTATVDILIQSSLEDQNYQYFAYKSYDFIEPLCGIYASEALKELYISAAQSSLNSFSLQKLMSSGKSKFLAIDNRRLFKNYNTLN